MKITAIAVSNFKRLNEIQFSPDGDRALLLIGGKNGQGKSSTLDALIAADQQGDAAQVPILQGDPRTDFLHSLAPRRGHRAG